MCDRPPATNKQYLLYYYNLLSCSYMEASTIYIIHAHVSHILIIVVPPEKSAIQYVLYAGGGRT